MLRSLLPSVFRVVRRYVRATGPALVLALAVSLMLAGGRSASAQGIAQPRTSAAPEGAATLHAPPPPTSLPDGSPAPASLGAVPPPPPAAPVPPAPGFGSPGFGAPGAESQFSVSASLSTRLRVLDTDLQQLSRGGNNTLGGVIGMATGGLSIALAFLATEDSFLRSYLVLYGSANILSGITEIAVRPNASGPSIAYTHMPMGNAAEVQARLEFGEASLERLARRARAARLIDASIDVAVGLAIVPIFLGPNDFSVGDPFNYFVLLGSGISVVTGIVNLVTRSTAEKYWAAYTTLRARLEAPRPSVNVGVAPMRQGLMFSLSGTL